MKKFRSKLPRRKRSNFSPILKLSPARKLVSTSIADSTSNLTRDVDFSCDSSSRISTNNKPAKKRSFVDENVAGEFRRITRSYSKRLATLKKEEIEVSESSSCVDLVDSSSKNVIRKGFDALNYAKAENDVVSVSVDVAGIENSEITTRSECSVFPKFLINGRDNLQGIEETDVVSISSRLLSPQPKFATIINEGQSAYTEPKSEKISAYVTKSETNETVNEGQSAFIAPKSGQIIPYINKSEVDETTHDDQPENCGESKLISDDFDLTCSENLSYEDEECNQSSAVCTDVNDESTEVEFSSDFVTSSWNDSGSQFSERSFGDTTPSPTFQLFLIYRQKFCESEFSTNMHSEFNHNETSDRIVKLLRPEDEEYEESYWMLKQRERRQVYLHDYAEEYCRVKEYGDLVVQQRIQMVHWIIEESTCKEFQKETLFLGVSLLDRFLTKGYFRNKRELEIAGIACLTLATRIEENQPFNSIRQQYFKVGSNEYRRSEVVAMEWLVQEVLNFQCFLPTIYNFLWFYLKAARADQDVDKTANYLAILALLGHEQLCYWPSTVAASLVILACLADNSQSSHQQIAWIHNGSNDKDLHDCVKVDGLTGVTVESLFEDSSI
ncbi:cyclin-SDS-like [Rutidosis leptorrhynchoides]|uniref:cyclin-SDS-like n=1 Tax=Rutidosis leptorrhynchoides TaxID=125765 RepID=UPI003A99375F